MGDGGSRRGRRSTTRGRVASVAVATLCVTFHSGAAGQPTDEQMIRDARARSNAAIAAHDLAGITRVWMNDVHIVSSTSAQGTGRTENQQRMARQFANRPDTVYVRRPATIDIMPSWSVAAERGEWTGTWTEPDGRLEISGTYLAQWRKLDGEWLIQAELFVATRCRGANYCAQRPQ